MRLPIILLIGLFLCGACHKDQKPSGPFTPLPDGWAGPQKYGWGKARLNGVEWEGSGSWNYVYSDSSKMAISFQTFDLDTVIIASLEIERIPLKVGRYELRKSDSQSPNSIYWIGYDDETDALYSLDGSQGGSVWVDAYDPVKKTIKGRFQAYFYRERSDLFNYPEEVSFEDGEFEVRLWQ